MLCMFAHATPRAEGGGAPRTHQWRNVTKYMYSSTVQIYGIFTLLEYFYFAILWCSTSTVYIFGDTRN